MKILKLTILLITLMVSRVAVADITGYALVVDGDTITIEGTKVRLHGIDTPESEQMCERNGVKWECGYEVAEILKRWLKAKEVRCMGDTHDIYGRLIADCFVDGYNVNARLVYEGLALAYRKYSDRYVAEEIQARIAGRGLWSGDFIMPWEWRRGKRLE